MTIASTLASRCAAALATTALALAGLMPAPLYAQEPAASPAPTEATPAQPAPTQTEPAPAPAKPAPRRTDQLQLDASKITGNRELPKVLSIVPWKRAGAQDLSGRPSDSLLNEVMAPIDRTEFRREMRYRATLDGAGGE